MANNEMVRVYRIAFFMTLIFGTLTTVTPVFSQNVFSEVDAGIIPAFISSQKVVTELNLTRNQSEQFEDAKNNVVQLMKDYAGSQGLFRIPGQEKKNKLREDLVNEVDQISEFLSTAQMKRFSQMALRFRIQVRRMQSCYPELDALLDQDERLGIELSDEVSADLADAVDEFNQELRDLLERQQQELRDLYLKHESAAVDLLPRMQRNQFREKIGTHMDLRQKRSLPGDN